MADVIDGNNNVTAGAGIETPGDGVQTQTPEPAGTGTATQTAGAIDFAKLDAILEKRMGGVLKSVLKGNGVEDADELSGIISAYRASKTEKAAQTATELETLRKENEAFKQKEKDAAIASAVSSAAGALGIDVNRLAMMKYDLGDAVDADGKIDAAKLNTVLTDLTQRAPWLKVENTGATGGQYSNGNQSGFVPGDGSSVNSQTEAEKKKAELNKIRKLAGLKPID